MKILQYMAKPRQMYNSLHPCIKRKWREGKKRKKREVGSDSLAGGDFIKIEPGVPFWGGVQNAALRVKKKKRDAQSSNAEENEGGMELMEIGAERTKNVLILMSDTGGGHRASAEAIRDAFKLNSVMNTGAAEFLANKEFMGGTNSKRWSSWQFILMVQFTSFVSSTQVTLSATSPWYPLQTGYMQGKEQESDWLSC